jgi:serine/threonine-protein kinase RsbW
VKRPPRAGRAIRLRWIGEILRSDASREATRQEPKTETYERRTDATPEEIGRLRREIESFARRAGASAAVVDDIRLAVTEACTNVVLHAYPGAGGPRPLLVRMTASDSWLGVAVRDWGSGIKADARTGGLGLGLALLHGLAASVEIVPQPDGGVEIRMRFPVASPS